MAYKTEIAATHERTYNGSVKKKKKKSGVGNYIGNYHVLLIIG